MDTQENNSKGTQEKHVLDRTQMEINTTHRNMDYILDKKTRWLSPASPPPLP